jgi:hypothetical protein
LKLYPLVDRNKVQYTSVRVAGNDGAVGNTLETLLGIEENNLPIPNAVDWELKGQRAKTSSLITLKHIEPSPEGARIVSNVLLPLYGWKHDKAGTKYPLDEMSFRSTTGALEHTSRGFIVKVAHAEKKVKFEFDASKVQTENEIWLKSVEERVGLGNIEPEPYWAFDDLVHKIGSKIKSCFYVVADSKKENEQEFFQYKELHKLSGFSFDGFLSCIEKGVVLIDFDARTRHNHGTKFRIRQNSWQHLYSEVERIL